VQAHHEVVRDLGTREVGDKRRELGRVERRQRQHAAVPHEIGQHRAEITRTVDLRIAVGADDDDRLVGKNGREKREQVHGRRVGPVQVVDHEEPGARRGRVAEGVGDRIEQLESGELAVTADDGGVDHVRTERPEQLCPRPERWGTFLGPTGDALGVDARLLREPDRFFGQPGLADARFTGDEDKSALSGRERVEIRLQLPDLAIPAHEHALMLRGDTDARAGGVGRDRSAVSAR